MKNKRTARKFMRILSGISAAAAAVTMMTTAVGADTYFYDDSSVEVNDNEIFRPLNAVNVSGGGNVNPDTDTDMEYSMLNNTPDFIYITDVSGGELQRYGAAGWETVVQGRYDSVRLIELEGFEGYEDTVDIKDLYGELPDGEYRIVLHSTNQYSQIYSENYLEFSVKHTVAFISEKQEFTLPMKKAMTLYISNNAPFNINSYYDESMRLSRYENGKWVNVSQKDSAEDYYLVSRVRSDKTNRVSMPLNTFFKMEKGGLYRLSVDWMCSDEDDIPDEYDGPISGTVYTDFYVTAPISAECVTAAAFGKEVPTLKLKITNNTGSRLVLKNFGRVQIKTKNGTWGYLAFKNKKLTASDIDTRLVLQPGETGTASIKLTDYYNQRDLTSSTCRAEVNAGGYITYVNFSVKSGNCVVVS